MERLQKILAAIDAANSKGIAVAPPPGILEGFSGEKFIGLLQRLAGLGGPYLEIGVFQGLTLLSTAYANPGVSCFGIDNFSHHDPQGKNEAILNRRAKDLDVKNWTLLNMDFEVALDRLHEFIREPLGLYLIDGPHDYRSQLICLAFAADKVAPYGAVVVDDSNYRHVRQATADFLKFRPDYKLVFEAYTPKHPANMNPAEEAEARKGWWDGIHVLVRDTDQLIDGLVPPTQPSQFFLDSDVHSAAMAPYAFDALNVLHALKAPWRLPKALARFVREAGRPHERAPYAFLNTYSDQLPTRTAKLRG